MYICRLTHRFIEQGMLLTSLAGHAEMVLLEAFINSSTLVLNCNVNR